MVYFNGKKLEKSKPQLIDSISDMTTTHDPYVSAKGGLEACLLMLKVDLKRGGSFGIMRYYILQLLKEKMTGQLTLWTRWGRLGERG